MNCAFIPCESVCYRLPSVNCCRLFVLRSSKLLEQGKKIRVGKPLATCIELTNLPSMTYEGLIDDDVKFIGTTLNLPEENLIPSVGLLDNISAEKRITNKDLSPGKGFEQIEALVNDDFDGLNIRI